MSSEAESDSSGSMLNDDVDWDKLYAPGDIKVGDPDRRRVIEELGVDDNDRVRFIDDAARMDDPVNKMGEVNNE